MSWFLKVFTPRSYFYGHHLPMQRFCMVFPLTASHMTSDQQNLIAGIIQQHVDRTHSLVLTYKSVKYPLKDLLERVLSNQLLPDDVDILNGLCVEYYQGPLMITWWWVHKYDYYIAKLARPLGHTIRLSNKDNECAFDCLSTLMELSDINLPAITVLPDSKYVLSATIFQGYPTLVLRDSRGVLISRIGPSITSVAIGGTCWHSNPYVNKKVLEQVEHRFNLLRNLGTM